MRCNEQMRTKLFNGMIEQYGLAEVYFLISQTVLVRSCVYLSVIITIPSALYSSFVQCNAELLHIRGKTADLKNALELICQKCAMSHCSLTIFKKNVIKCLP